VCQKRRPENDASDHKPVGNSEKQMGNTRVGLQNSWQASAGWEMSEFSCGVPGPELA